MRLENGIVQGLFSVRSISLLCFSDSTFLWDFFPGSASFAEASPLRSGSGKNSNLALELLTSNTDCERVQGIFSENVRKKAQGQTQA